MQTFHLQTSYRTRNGCLDFRSQDVFASSVEDAFAIAEANIQRTQRVPGSATRFVHYYRPAAA